MEGKGAKEEDEERAGSVQWLRAVFSTEQSGAKGPELWVALKMDSRGPLPPRTWHGELQPISGLSPVGN